MPSPLSDRLSAMSALIVDESRFMRSLIADLLRAIQLNNVQFAASGDDAIAQMRAWSPDVTFIAREMDPRDGVSLTRWIRTSPESPAPQVPIILMTASTKQGDILEARDAGVTELVIKPVTPKAVYSRLKAVLAGPRSFVESPVYTGPCRRRRRDDDYAGPARRLDDPIDGVDPALLEEIQAALDAVADAANTLDPRDRSALRSLLARAETARELIGRGRDAQLSGALDSLVRYIRGVGATGQLGTDIVHMHLAAAARLIDLSETDSTREAVIVDLDADLSARGRAV